MILRRDLNLDLDQCPYPCMFCKPGGRVKDMLDLEVTETFILSKRQVRMMTRLPFWRLRAGGITDGCASGKTRGKSVVMEFD